MTTRYLFRSAAVVLAAVTMSACTTVHKNFKPFTPIQTQLESAPMKVAVVLPEALCSFYYNNVNFLGAAFVLGPVICENMRSAARQAFANPRFYSSTDEIRYDEVDAIAKIRPGSALAYPITGQIPARFITTVGLSWEFRTVDGQKQYHATVYGDGLDRRTLGWVNVRFESSMQRCMDDLAMNMYQEMAAAFEKADNNAKASEHILSAIENYEEGILTYSQYQDKKKDDWYIYALDEHAKYGGSRYSYLIDPESDQYVSDVGGCVGDGMLLGSSSITYDTVGMSLGYNKRKYYRELSSWVTQWDRRQGVIESLRPSTYIPDSEIENANVSEVYIKEIVGSVYDNHPLCELVFEGNSFESAVLTRSSCQKDYKSIGVYESKDIYHEHMLSETAQKWLELRVAMSREEVIELIGYPPRQTLDTSTGGSTFEYGYGRLRLDDSEGLSCWQLSD